MEYLQQVAGEQSPDERLSLEKSHALLWTLQNLKEGNIIPYGLQRGAISTSDARYLCKGLGVALAVC